MYGFTIGADVVDGYKCVSSHWMKTTNDENVVERFPLKDEIIMVKTKDHDDVDDIGWSKKINSQPCHLGSFTLSFSRKLMNDVILSLDGFKSNKPCYSDVSSVNIRKNDYNF